MLRTDLKIFKSERMTQQPDAGGQRTSNEVLNGQLNEVFGNISDIDHAQSAVDIVKIYPAVATNDTALLQDGHILINEPTLDTLVDVMIIESDAINDGSTRADIINAIESSVVPSLLLRSGLSEMIAGQDQLNILDLTSYAPPLEQPRVSLSLGAVYAISVEYTGSESLQWPRFTHYIKIVELTQVLIKFEPPIPLPAPGRTTLINNQNYCTKLRAVTDGAGVQYHGVTQLTTDAASVTLQVERTVGRVTPRITESIARLNNMPFPPTEQGLLKTNILLPAVGATYSVEIDDYIFIPGNPAFSVNYISSGRSYSVELRNSAIVDNILSFVIDRIPAAGTNVVVSYLSSERYQMYSNADEIPAGYTLLFRTIVGSVLHDSGTLSSVVPDDDPTRLMVISSNPYILPRLAAVIDPNTGAVTYYNNYSNLQFTAVLANDSAVGESATSGEFVLPFDNGLHATFYMSVELVVGGLLSASSDASGDITGVNVTGTISGKTVNLTFAEPVKLSTLQYSISEVTELVPPKNLYGINSLRLPNGGAVKLFRPFGVICVAHNQYEQYPALTAAQTIARRPNSFIDIVDSTGASLWHPLNTHYEYDKATGEVTIVDASSFTAPFELVDTLSELALVTAVTQNTLKIARALQSDFPAGSIVSSVYQLGDLQARVTNIFDQVTWNSVWSDVIVGDPAPANYNSVNYPIEVVNQSAINERWAIVFTSDSAYRCIGQNVGQVGTGDTLNDFAPINPATGQPFFIIRGSGWGGGWLPGNVVRFNTVAASKPAVLLRSVSAGHSDIEQDSIRTHFRGNAQ